MDKQTADGIITEYLQKIYGFAIKKSYSYHEAEEICAEIIKETYLSLLKAKEIANMDGYIWRISQYTYSKYVSQQKKHAGISLNNIQLSYSKDFSIAEHNEEIFHLRTEIAFLTEKRRQIVYRYYPQFTRNYTPQHGIISSFSALSSISVLPVRFLRLP